MCFLCCFRKDKVSDIQPTILPEPESDVKFPDTNFSLNDIDVRTRVAILAKYPTPEQKMIADIAVLRIFKKAR